MIPSPQLLTQLLGAHVHTYHGSDWHELSQPSQFVAFQSSHVSSSDILITHGSVHHTTISSTVSQSVHLALHAQ